MTTASVAPTATMMVSARRTPVGRDRRRDRADRGYALIAPDLATR
jgi:hypothetical protein